VRAVAGLKKKDQNSRSGRGSKKRARFERPRSIRLGGERLGSGKGGQGEERCTLREKIIYHGSKRLMNYREDWEMRSYQVDSCLVEILLTNDNATAPARWRRNPNHLKSGGSKKS